MINYIIKAILQIECNFTKLKQFFMMRTILHFQDNFQIKIQKQIKLNTLEKN